MVLAALTRVNPDYANRLRQDFLNALVQVCGMTSCRISAPQGALTSAFRGGELL